MSDIIVKWKKLQEDAQEPTKHLDAACFDLYSIQEGELSYNNPITIRTGLALEIPTGYTGLIFTRSGMGFKGVRAHLGVIDPDFRGEITVRLFLHDKNEGMIVLPKGSKIAQIFFAPILPVIFEAVEELAPSERGENGYGSSGQ